MPSTIRQSCNTCKHGVPHPGFIALNVCGREWNTECITVTGRRYWEASYKARAEALEEYERSQGIVNEFIKADEMRI